MTEFDLAALRAGDEAAFLKLVGAYHSVLLRLAMVYSPTREIAEESVQETWLAALRGLDGFAGRSSLRTWLCRILVNIARRRAGAEARSVPFASLGEPAVDPDLFLRTGEHAGHWASPPADWSGVPEHRLLSAELRAVVAAVVAALPANQAVVVTLRDVEGWDVAEVRELLDITDGHQRVLLHRARSKVRAALADYLDL